MVLSSPPGSLVWYRDPFLVCPWADPFQPHNLMLLSCPLIFPPLFNFFSFLCFSSPCSPFSSPKCALLKFWSGIILSDFSTQGGVSSSAFFFLFSLWCSCSSLPPHPLFLSGETSLGTEEAAPVEDECSDPQHCQADHRKIPLQNQQEWVTCFTVSLSLAPKDGLWAGGEPRDLLLRGDPVLKFPTC